MPLLSSEKDERAWQIDGPTGPSSVSVSGYLLNEPCTTCSVVPDWLAYSLTAVIIVGYALSYQGASKNDTLTAVSDILAHLPPMNVFIYLFSIENWVVRYIKLILLGLWIVTLFLASVVVGAALFTFQLSVEGSLGGIPLVEEMVNAIAALLVALTISSVIGTLGGTTQSVCRSSVETIRAVDDYWTGERSLANITLVAVVFLSIIATEIVGTEIESEFLLLSFVFSITLLTLYAVMYHSLYLSLISRR